MKSLPPFSLPHTTNTSRKFRFVVQLPSSYDSPRTDASWKKRTVWLAVVSSAASILPRSTTGSPFSASVWTNGCRVRFSVVKSETCPPLQSRQRRMKFVPSCSPALTSVSARVASAWNHARGRSLPRLGADLNVSRPSATVTSAEASVSETNSVPSPVLVKSPPAVSVVTAMSCAASTAPPSATVTDATADAGEPARMPG